MTIEVGTDPSLPVALTCNIHSSTGQLEVKYNGTSLTHPSDTLRVTIDDLDWATFQTSDFGSYTVAAVTLDGQSWSDGGTSITSENLGGDEDPGKAYDVEVTATDGGTPKTVTIHIRVREEGINPLP